MRTDMEGYLNVKDYGAAGNGTNDDARAIANAIAASRRSECGLRADNGRDPVPSRPLPAGNGLGIPPTAYPSG
ncbi:glycosyl hydrolase family 28-related protein [Cohnella rhizosphaerae]|uniref:Rhamnogalacturonase A/B/Epimerase-like pectate lyase domain-containing protein n=1 Tax=Cohnella rhizosphaerae TaxID=1457232 RepID=A0A9X4QX22_9BACL|nr:glycosyl hydrolase family 28-related protein [Cohnella rhizosphaerae]MDG0814405.1 hypothetical protein [Cohnella rhizosphaerae]